MKKRLLCRISAWSVVLLMVCMNLIVPVSADGGSSVTVSVTPQAEGMTLAIYEAADYIDGHYVLNTNFSGCDVALENVAEASAAQAAAEKLAAFAAAHEISGKDAAIGQDGTVTFDGLSENEKLYLIVQTSGKNIVIQPMLAAVPYYTSDGGYHNTVSIQAKFNVIEPKGAVILIKTDRASKRLPGAEFTFSEERVVDGNAEWVVISEKLVTDVNGQIVVENLPYGTYSFTETKAPKGFAIDKTPHVFKIDSEGTVKLENGFYTAESGSPYVLFVANSPITDQPDSSRDKSDIQKSDQSSDQSSEQSSRQETSQSSEGVYTGSDSNTWLIVFGCVGGGALVVAIILVIVSGKKKK